MREGWYLQAVTLASVSSHGGFATGVVVMP